MFFLFIHGGQSLFIVLGGFLWNLWLEFTLVYLNVLGVDSLEAVRVPILFHILIRLAS